MSLVDQEDELDNLQLQTRDPFQLELLDAVRRRQKRETGFEDDVDKRTQRHSKEMDIKMSKYLSNKQSPFHTDNSKRESSSSQGETGGTMYPGSTGGVNNALTTRSVYDSKWKPSFVIDSDDDIDGESSSDDEDDIVIGSNARIPREDTKVTNKVLYDNETQEHKSKNDHLPDTSDIPVESGLKQKASISSKLESESFKISELKENNIEPKRKVSSERLGIQRRKQFSEEEVLLDAKDSSLSPSIVLQETDKGNRETNMNTKASTEKPAFQRRGKYSSFVDSDDEMNLRNHGNMEGSSSQRKSKVDDIFEFGVTRKQGSLQHIDGNSTHIGSTKFKGGPSSHESSIDVGRKSGVQSPRSRSGSGIESQLDAVKSAYKRNLSGDSDIQSVSRHASDKPKTRSSSGKNTPETGKGSFTSGRSSPADNVFASVSRELSKPEKKADALQDDKPRSRSGSGKSSQSHLFRSQSKEETVSKENTGRAKSGVREEPDRSKSRSSSGKTTPERGKAHSTSGRSSPAEGLLTCVSRELSKSERKAGAPKEDKLLSNSGQDSKNYLSRSQSKEENFLKEKTERPKSARVREDAIKGDNRHVEKKSERGMPSRGSKDELKQTEDAMTLGAKQRSNSPHFASKTSLNHRRSHSIGNSPREREDSETPASSRGTFGGRSRSKSDAMGLDDQRGSGREKDNRHEGGQSEKELNRLGSKYSLKKPSSMRSLNNNDVGSDSDDDDDEEPIGIRRSSRTLQKGGDLVDPRSQLNDDRRTTPNIKKPLGSEVHTAERSRNKEIIPPVEDHGLQTRFDETKSRKAIPSTVAKDPLSKFKIKGRGEASHGKKTPVKSDKDIKVTQPSAGRTAMRPKDSPNGTVKHGIKKRSLSFTNISNIKPKSPYRENENHADRRENSIVDSETLREQIYYDWLKQKSSRTKEETKELRRREKEKEEEAEKEKEDKKVMSKKAFEAWTADKEESLKVKRSEIKEKRTKEKEKQDEELQKKLDSKKHFESWKSNKERELIEQHRKRKEEKREQQRRELEDQEEKRNSSKKVYDNWKSKKEELLKEQLKEKKEMEKEKRLEQIEKMEKKRKAEKLFETWKETKQKSPRERTTLTQRAWCPSGRNSQNIIPESVKPVIQRNPPSRTRTLSATARLQNRTMCSTFNRM